MNIEAQGNETHPTCHMHLVTRVLEKELRKVSPTPSPRHYHLQAARFDFVSVTIQISLIIQIRVDFLLVFVLIPASEPATDVFPFHSL